MSNAFKSLQRLHIFLLFKTIPDSGFASMKPEKFLTKPGRQLFRCYHKRSQTH